MEPIVDPSWPRRNRSTCGGGGGGDDDDDDDDSDWFRRTVLCYHCDHSSAEIPTVSQSDVLGCYEDINHEISSDVVNNHLNSWTSCVAHCRNRVILTKSHSIRTEIFKGETL